RRHRTEIEGCRRRQGEFTTVEPGQSGLVDARLAAEIQSRHGTATIAVALLGQPGRTAKTMSEPFDATALGEIVTKAKKQIRSRMKALRGGYSAAALAERSSRIVENVLAHPRLSEARSVASFWPMIDRGEVDLRPLDERLRARGVQLYYPFMERISEGRVRT